MEKLLRLWIAGEERNAYFLGFIDCFTREAVKHYLGFHCNGGDVRETMFHAFHDRGIGAIGNMRIRNDNGIYRRSCTLSQW